MTLDELFKREGADKQTGMHGYAPVYEELFEPRRHEPLTLLEIGVYQGASIRSWLEYFPIARIIGVDCDAQFLSFSERYEFFHGRQEDPKFLDGVRKAAGPFDIVIDDGSHRPNDQRVSFMELWPVLRPGGYYVIEDIQCWFDQAQSPAYTAEAPVFLWTMAATVNWHGVQYLGRPGTAQEIDAWDPAFDWVRIHKGLLIIHKKP